MEGGIIYGDDGNDFITVDEMNGGHIDGGMGNDVIVYDPKGSTTVDGGDDGKGLDIVLVQDGNFDFRDVTNIDVAIIGIDASIDMNADFYQTLNVTIDSEANSIILGDGWEVLKNGSYFHEQSNATIEVNDASINIELNTTI